MTDTDRNRPSLGDALDLLAEEHRRRLLLALLDSPPAEPIQVPNDLLTRGDPERLELRMTHRHLPKLDEAEVVDWHESTDEVFRGPWFDEVASLLQSVRDHADRFPSDGR